MVSIADGRLGCTAVVLSVACRPTGDLTSQAKSRSGMRYTVAKNTGRNFRRGAVRRRSQVQNPHTGDWTKRDADTGKFMDGKKDGQPFKGVRREK